MTRIVGLDFETYSATDIRRGLKNYFEDPHFKVLMAAIAITTDEGIEAGVLDFVHHPERSLAALEEHLEGADIVAHNALFEYAVLDKLGLNIDAARFIDSAVLASIGGAGRSLEAAAPQMLGVDKLASGKEGIQLFCIPGTYQMESGSNEFDPKVIDDHKAQWDKFAEYCALDAALSIQIATLLAPVLDPNELTYSTITMEMNLQGWKVDVDLVEEMQRRYKENTDALVQEFREACDAPDLNLFSSKQLIDWCAERKIRATSFDEQHVASMKKKIEKKLDSVGAEAPERAGYEQVLHLLNTKQALGGSSLKKLRTILDTVSKNGRLFDQYAHAGAGTTLRTSARGVQMQNIHRLGGKGDPVSELMDPDIHWDNAKMARNLRQVFTATHPLGHLVVGDYKAVESRGLAWFAGEEWKLDAYRKGIDVYKMQAAKFFDVPFESATPEHRTFGKVGELSCGYYAGPEAVKGFAEKMGVILTDGEAKKLVMDFRRTNPRTVEFWHALQAALEEAFEVGVSHVVLPHGKIAMATTETVDSLLNQEKGRKLKSLMINVQLPGGEDGFRFKRVFHGLYRDGSNFSYYRPSERKTGDLWVPDYTDPKTGQRKRYSLYGGKLAGVLTQSLCRQIFMDGMLNTYLSFLPSNNVKLVGQFHDELVLDVSPATAVLHAPFDEAVAKLKRIMSTTTLPEFPLDCEVKWDYRYTK